MSRAWMNGLIWIGMVACVTEDAASPGPGWEAAASDEVRPDGTAFFVDEQDRVFKYAGTGSVVEIPAGRIPASQRAESVPAEEVGPVSRLIFDSDNRVPYTSTSVLAGYNKRTIGRLAAGEDQCTGALVGPRHVLTNAHCLINNLGQLVSTSSITFAPGFRGIAHSPYNVNGEPRRASTYYLRSSTDTWDYALVILKDEPETAALGWMGLYYNSSDSWYEGRTMSLVGYPGEMQICANTPFQISSPPYLPCARYMYGQQCPIDSAGEDLEYECDAQKGQSGAPLYVWFDNEPFVIGVNRGSHSGINSYNKGVRLTSGKINDLCDWIVARPSVYATHWCQTR